MLNEDLLSVARELLDTKFVDAFEQILQMWSDFGREVRYDHPCSQIQELRRHPHLPSFAIMLCMITQ